MARQIDSLFLPAGDATTQIVVRIGGWMDESEGMVLPAVADALTAEPLLQPIEEFVSGSVSRLRDAEFNPWAHHFQLSAFYAGAAGHSCQLLIDIAPIVREVLDEENIRIVAASLLGAIFGRLLSGLRERERHAPEPTLADVSERVREYMVWRDGLAPRQVEEIGAVKREDESFEILVRRTTDGQRYLFRLNDSGSVVARVNLDALAGFYETHADVSEAKSDDR